MIEHGKIQSVRLGSGGYQDAMFGFTFVLGGKNGWGTCDFWGTWGNHNEYCKWTIPQQEQAFLEAFLKVKKLMADASVSSFADLKDTPIEAEFDGGVLKQWRIMAEVL